MVTKMSDQNYPFVHPHVEIELDVDFEDALDRQIYHSLWGCDQEGSYIFPKTAYRAIMNWCGNCTDPANGPDYFNNPRAMFAALNLIYKLLDELQYEDLVMDLRHGKLISEFRIAQIIENSPYSERVDTPKQNSGGTE